jgi:hypothetical protein
MIKRRNHGLTPFSLCPSMVGSRIGIWRSRLLSGNHGASILFFSLTDINYIDYGMPPEARRFSRRIYGQFDRWRM